MISLYSGTPGSGKSLHMARDIRQRLHFKKRVTIGNFYINVHAVKKVKGYYLYVPNHKLTPQRLMKFSKRMAKHLGRRLKEGEIVVYIDEAQLLFNSRDWNTPGRQDWLTFFTQHRHFGFDIILIAQFDRMLDRQVRALIEYDYIHRKVSNAGLIGSIIGLICLGNLFVYIKKWYPISQSVESEFFFGGKKLYSVYDSYNYFESIDVKPKKKAAPSKSVGVGLGAPAETP